MSNLATYDAVQQQGFDDLVTRHAPLVKRIAYHLMNRLPPSVQAEDLIQAGMIGLIEASRNYDPSQGASFETYAGIRIRGAMLDEIRRSDWTPRSVHRKARMVADAMREIENAEGRDARDVEVAGIYEADSAATGIRRGERSDRITGIIERQRKALAEMIEEIVPGSV